MAQHHGQVLVERGDYRVLDCDLCGFAHLEPVPDEVELQRYYADTFYTDSKPDYIRRFEEDLPWWRLQYTEWLDLVSAACESGGRKLLDLGCGPGFLLATARELGWDCSGIDASPVAVQYAREALGLNVIQGFVEGDLGTAMYDAVVLNCVLEHVAAPRLLLERVWKCLKPGGITCVVVPNDFSVLQHAAREELDKTEWWVAVPDHINYFNYESLERLLARVGFQPVARTTNWPMEFFLLMGEDYVGDDAFGRRLHHKRVSLDLQLGKYAESERRRFYRSLAELGWGRDAVVIARKIECMP